MSLFIFMVIMLCCFHLNPTLAQVPANTTGYACSINQTTSPCKTYVFYRAQTPSYLDLANISDLFAVSSLMITKPNNISYPSTPLLPDQSLLIPIDCSCNNINSTFSSLSYAPINHTLIGGDTFWKISTFDFENLTTFQSIEAVNPTVNTLNLTIGETIIVPVFCKCPTPDQLRNGTNFLISYVFQPSDNLTSVATKLGSTTSAIIDINGNNINTFDTLFVPVSRLPVFPQAVKHS